MTNRAGVPGISWVNDSRKAGRVAGATSALRDGATIGAADPERESCRPHPNPVASSARAAAGINVRLTTMRMPILPQREELRFPEVARRVLTAKVLTRSAAQR